MARFLYIIFQKPIPQTVIANFLGFTKYLPVHEHMVKNEEQVFHAQRISISFQKRMRAQAHIYIYSLMLPISLGNHSFNGFQLPYSAIWDYILKPEAAMYTQADLLKQFYSYT